MDNFVVDEDHESELLGAGETIPRNQAFGASSNRASWMINPKEISLKYWVPHLAVARSSTKCNYHTPSYGVIIS